MSTAKQLSERARDFLQIGNRQLKGYFFTESELHAFVTALCKEQRENCAEKAEIEFYGVDLADIDKDSILNAPEPEVL